MAGTFNNATGYIDVNGVYTGEIVVNGKYSIDSDFFVRLTNPLDSDQVKTIANTVRLNDLIDSDHIAGIAVTALTGTTSQVNTNVINIASNTLKLARHDSDIAQLAQSRSDVTAVVARVSSLENNDTIQDASITTSATDIAALKLFTGTGTTLTTTATALASGINELDAQIGAGTLSTTASTIVAAINELDAEIGNISTLTNAATTLVGVANDYETRITALEALVSALIARVGGGSTPIALNDLSDVTTGTPVVGQQLTWNGTGWVAANDQV